MRYHIRPCTPDDIAFVGELLSDTCNIHHNGRNDVFKAGGRKYTDNDIIALLERNDVFVDICVADGEKVGYCIQFFRQTDEDSCRHARRVLFIDDLCIDAKHRSQGAGGAMVDAAKKRAAELGCDAVELNVWAFNKGAIAFYERHGFGLQKSIYEFLL